MSENVGEVLSCGWIGSFGSGKVASNGEMDESCCHSQDQPNAKRKRNVSSWKNPHVEKRIVRSGNGEEMVECDEEDVVHYRAKRGQATSSHSLEERMRRERISERMRLLQSLVPGCDKVTGKALVLGEIINYVQSLQQQVEFLSMKLADVNQELNVGIEQILPKDLLDPRGSNGIDTNSTRSIPETSHGKTCTSPLLPQGLEVRSMQNLWHNELQSILHTSSLQENGDFYNQTDH